jgi:hypothetical protein
VSFRDTRKRKITLYSRRVPRTDRSLPAAVTNQNQARPYSAWIADDLGEKRTALTREAANDLNNSHFNYPRKSIALFVKARPRRACSAASASEELCPMPAQ